jgi:competence protein ComFB
MQGVVMDVHNTVEDMVISRVNEIFEALNNEVNIGNFCTCNQCRMDVICYALNRTTPHYIVSHRGASRAIRENIERQQRVADITALIHEGLKRVNHNQRPNFAHSGSAGETGLSPNPVFNVPTSIGRILTGNNFAPLSDTKVELLRNGELVPMKDGNWQNPCQLVSNTEGNFSFWPDAVESSAVDERLVFEFCLRATAPEFETLNHFFKINVASEVQETGSFSLDRTFKLPNLYMFPPGGEEDDFLD